MNDDIDDQGTFDPTINTINQVNNYRYDKIGNLVRDSAEGIATIDWTVYGKIKSVTHRTGYYRMNGTDTVRPADLYFNYDAAGNRITKVIKPRTATGTKASNYWTTQVYVRDAQGNVMSVYNQHDSAAISAAYFTQIEKHLYGSSRIGIENTNTELLGASFATDTTNHFAGNKSFELSNHLGNVLTTISDKKIPLDTNANDTIDYYVADIRSATDYAPFGAPLEGRNWINSSYRYGFNGKEKDGETYGAGNEYDYGMRIYDPRLGRFMSVDPIGKQFPRLSPYQYAANTPIWAKDLDGKEAEYTNPGVNTLVVVIQGWEKTDPRYYHTQVKNNSSATSDDGDFNELNALNNPKLKVVQFSSSDEELDTKVDVVATIRTFQKNNPHGKVVLVGHSLGADNAVEIVKENPDIKVDYLFTVDISDGLDYDDDEIPSNVGNAVNFYQTNPYDPGGEKVKKEKGNKTSNVVNVAIPNTSHIAIDNDVTPLLKKLIQGIGKASDAQNGSGGGSTKSKSGSGSSGGSGGSGSGSGGKGRVQSGASEA